MHDREALERWRPRETRRAGDRDRRRPDRRAAPAPASPPCALHERSATIASTSRSTALGELLALAREHLDAVVLERIVRRGDHHAGVVAAGARQVGDRRRRHDAGARHRRAFAARAVRELRLDPLAGLARVAADQELRRRRAVRQRAHERRAEPPDGRRIERMTCPPCRGRRRFRTDVASIQFLPLVIRTCTVAGSMRVDARVARASRRAPSASIRRRPSPARSTNAVRSSASTRLERVAAAAQRDVDGRRHRLAPAGSAPRLRRCTGWSRSVRSSGAGRICTVTIADRGVFSRSDGSSKPDGHRLL